MDRIHKNPGTFKNFSEIFMKNFESRDKFIQFSAESGFSPCR